MRTHTPLRALTAAAVCAPVVTACGQGSDEPASDTPTARAGTGPAAAANESDVGFLQLGSMLEPFGAERTADDALGGGSDGEVAALAEAVVSAQPVGSDQTRGWQQAWGPD